MLISGLTATGLAISPGGVLFLAIVFLPAIVAYRRDRLTFPILFAMFFLPTWPWAMYKAASRKPNPTLAREPADHAVTSTSM